MRILRTFVVISLVKESDCSQQCFVQYVIVFIAQLMAQYCVLTSNAQMENFQQITHLIEDRETQDSV